MRSINKRLKSAILIDEGNAMNQLRDLGIIGLKSWKAFYEAVEDYLKENYGNKMVTDYNFYGALPPKKLQEQRYHNRYKFFDSLQHAGIYVKKGECHLQHNRLVEKGIDLLIGLDIVQCSFYNYQYVVIFSGDADFLPAIVRAKENGTFVIAILARDKAAYSLRKNVDVVVDLEMMLGKLSSDIIVRKSPVLKESRN